MACNAASTGTWIVCLFGQHSLAQLLKQRLALVYMNVLLLCMNNFLSSVLLCIIISLFVQIYVMTQISFPQALLWL